MALKNSALIFFVTLIATFHQVEATIVLPELLTKQSVNNIRFLTKDGKFTYYQKRAGSLVYSSNYKAVDILKSNIGTTYTLFATPARKKIAVLQNPYFHNFYSLRAKENIYLLDYGETVPREVGVGTSPTLLLNDSWLSYYDPYSKILNFENTTNAALKFSIKLNNRINPYFTPQVIMSDDNTVYYTDLSEAGIYGVLEFKRNTAVSEIIYKAPNPMMRVEICLNQDQLILGTFGIHFSKNGSTISKAPLPLKNFEKRESIYTSEFNDLGHMVCDFDQNNIAFIQGSGKLTSPNFDIASLNTDTKKITPMSEKKTISNIINMDGILLTQEKGKYFIVKGDVDYRSIDLLKSKSDILPDKLDKKIEEDE